jgi:hypothetical protein
MRVTIGVKANGVRMEMAVAVFIIDGIVSSRNGALVRSNRRVSVRAILGVLLANAAC